MPLYLEVGIKVIDKKSLAAKRLQSKISKDEKERKKIVLLQKGQHQAILSEDYKVIPLDISKMMQDLALEKKKREDKRKDKEQEEKMGNIVTKMELEVQLMMRLDHPNIVKIYQVIESDAELFIVM